MRQEHGRSVFEQAVQGGATLQAEEALRQIEPVFDEVQALEKNIGELAALFTELAMLVNAQGEVGSHDCFRDLGCVALNFRDLGCVSVLWNVGSEPERAFGG